MNFTSNCPLCGSDIDLDKVISYTSPFFSHYVLEMEPIPINFMHCRGCHFMFFDARPNDKEMAILYSDYRGTRYCAARKQYEGDTHEKSVDHDKIDDLRRSHLNKQLAAIRWECAPKAEVLDHGGDKGQFFSNAFREADKYVYEISGADPIPGVRAIRTEAELCAHSFDFIMNCHVIEHISNPVEYVKKLKSLGHRDTLFYFETPHQCPSKIFYSILKTAKWMAQMIKKKNVGTSSSRIGRLVDSILMRPWLHEHINFYSPSAIGALMKMAGLRVVSLRVDRVVPSKSETVICCFAKW
jgi:hypothetical protein